LRSLCRHRNPMRRSRLFGPLLLAALLIGANLAQAQESSDAPKFGLRAQQVSDAGSDSVTAPDATTACVNDPPSQTFSIDPSNLHISISHGPASTAFLLKRRNILINFCTDPPVSGQVRVFIQRLSTSPGHTGIHPNPPPHGWLTSGSTDRDKFPLSFVDKKFEPSGTPLYSDYSGAFIVELDSTGKGSVLYGVPEVSGDETITASFLYRGQRQDRSLLVHVLEPGLEDLAPQAGDLIELTGTSSTQGKRHPSNHWGTREMNAALLVLARNYVADYQRTVLLPRSASRLPLNDMSLISGGVFDLEGNWNRPDGSHVGHRAGVEADVGGGGTEGHGLAPGKYEHFAQIMLDQGSFGLFPEGKPPHWHIVLKNPGKASVRNLPAKNARIDADRIQVFVPLENQGGVSADHINLTSLSASHGVVIISPVVSATAPFDMGPAEIRSPKTLTITAGVPPGVPTFHLFIAGEAIANGSAYPIPPVNPARQNRQRGFLDAVVDVPPPNSLATKRPVPFQATAASPGWTLTLTDTDQPIVIGADMIYHGVITNETGAPISFSMADIYYDTFANGGSFTYDLADEFVNIGAIPEGGYSGPLFKVRWTDPPAIAAAGEIWFTITPNVDSGLPFLEANTPLAYKPQAIQGSVNNGILTLSWSLEATNMQLQSCSALAEPEWVDVPGNVTQVNGMNNLELPVPTKRTYFRLVSLDGEDVVGESSVFTAGPSALLNISTRMPVLTGDNVLIAGFIITGNASKDVIVRAIGPSLSNAGVPNPLPNPVLELHDASGMLIAQNDDWQTSQIGGVITADQVADIQASAVAPIHPNESAIIATLSPGAYTAIIRGSGGTTGVGLAEVFDLTPTADSTLANISTRGLVQTGDNVMIGGFIAGSAGATRVIVRAIGPSLPLPSALADPTLELHDANGNAIATNDDWRSDQESDIIATLLPPANDLESAIVQTLSPGNYTAIVRGYNETTGVAVVEVYNLE
jgi:hypothetical protein